MFNEEELKKVKEKALETVGTIKISNKVTNAITFFVLFFNIKNPP